MDNTTLASYPAAKSLARRRPCGTRFLAKLNLDLGACQQPGATQVRRRRKTDYPRGPLSLDASLFFCSLRLYIF
jgi:hypothetical protein